MSDRPTIRIVIRKNAPNGWHYDVYTPDSEGEPLYFGYEDTYSDARAKARYLAFKLDQRAEIEIEEPK